jgi:hypothetical protein
MTTINNIKSSIKVLFFVILLIGATANTYSQAQNQNLPQQDQSLDEDADEMTPPDDIDPLNVPFDGGASILLASGLAYGAKKYREKKSRKTKESGETESK